MKFIILSLVISFSLQASIEVDPQGGNGGNICSSIASKSSGYRVLEEFQFPRYAPKRYRLGHNLIQWRTTSPYDETAIRGDLTRTAAGRKVYLRFLDLKKHYPEFAVRLIDLFFFLKETTLTEHRFRLPYGASTEIQRFCRLETLEAAIRTDDLGRIILSEAAWRIIPFESQQILLIHETLRFAQMFTPWGSGMSNHDLQEFTMILYAARFSRMKTHPFYKSFKAKIGDMSEYTLSTLNDLKEQNQRKINKAVGSRNFASAVRYTMLKANDQFYIDQKSGYSEFFQWSDAFNQLRTSKEYRETIDPLFRNEVDLGEI